MKLGIMQPYFFPYIGYFSLIKHTDKWIILDEVQYIRHGWIERNRILKPNDGWQYIKVPLEKHSRDTKIKDIKIRNNEDWKNKILRQLEHYKKAPYYFQTIELIKKIFVFETDSIVKLNVEIMKTICNYLSIDFNVEIFSTMDIEVKPVNHPGEWALNISKSLNASEYANPIGGKEIFINEEFEKAGIDIVFLENNLSPYNQLREGFEPGLSIIDVIMFNDINEINTMIDDFNYIKPL